MRRAAAFLVLVLTALWLVDQMRPRIAPGPPVRPAPEVPGPALVLVSIDGFRHDYLDRPTAHAPTLRRLAAEGVRADGMVPVYPSVTLPNHWSLVTGLHPEAHGIVGNAFRAPGGRRFEGDRKTGMTDAAWWGGEPLWETAERQGLSTGTVFWPGSEARPPERWLRYDAAMPYAARVDTALAWLDGGAQFVTLYVEAVDGAGHGHGPDAPEVDRAIERVDRALARLVDGLHARGRGATTDLVVVSDHGMTALSRERLAFLDDAVDLDAEIEHVVWEEPVGLWPRPGADVDDLVARLDALDHVRAFRRAETPAHLHYRENDRIAPVVVLADMGWTATTRARAEADPALPIAGSHGFDVRERSMHALFVAHGPRFRARAEIGTVRTVEMHGLLARALGIEPAPGAAPSPLADLALR